MCIICMVIDLMMVHSLMLTDQSQLRKLKLEEWVLGLCDKAKRGKQLQSVLDSLPLLLNVVWPCSKT